MGTLNAPTPLWGRLRRPGPTGCRHVRWPDNARPAVWSTAAHRILDAEDRRSLIFAAATAAAHQGLHLDRRTVHVCKIADGRRIWTAVTRPPRARSPRWQWTLTLARWLGIR